ncbi:MAG: hypothetical protein GY835_06545 [bacterium]|nr:hypothetical protein [bacterium]
MNDVVLTSSFSRLLIDSALFAADADYAAEGRTLLEELSGKPELLLYQANGGDTVGSEGFSRILVDAPNSFTELERVLQAGLLDDTLLVTPRERLVAWARRHKLPVVSPEPGQPLSETVHKRALVVRDTASLIIQSKRMKEDRPLLIGVNGISKAGKASFTSRIAEQLRGMGFNIIELSLDLFIAPRKQRRARGYSVADLYYHKYFDMERLHEQLLQPMFSGRSNELRIDAYDLRKERVSETRVHELDRKTIVLLQGPFLFQRDYFSTFDFRIYLVTDFERSLSLELNGLEGKKREKRQREFTQRDLAAHSCYLRLENPWKRAHLVVRGVNSDEPSIEEFRFNALDDGVDNTLTAFDL